MDRLRRLEGVVQNLNAQVEEHEQENAERERQAVRGECPNGERRSHSPSVALDNSVDGLESRFGRLVVDQGRSRYINNSFWASLNNEVEDLKSILIEPSDDEDDYASPETSQSSEHQGFMFGFSSTNVDMLSLHPPIERALEFWQLYKENVDPLVKVLHIPSIEPTLLDAFTHPEKVPKGLESLMFSIYYGAVTSTLPEVCEEKWGVTRDSLLTKYRFGLEQALARANFLFCDETVILQAFVVFLMLLRRNDDARKIWTLTGLVVRIAQTLGIHRDGSHFALAPFEIEMRRRLWWQVCILDARASEDHGCDPTIVEAQFDTKMPLNVNDSDLDPEMKEFPPERTGFTEITFCLIRFEVINIFRRIFYVPPGPNVCNAYFSSLTIPEKEKWISDCHQRLEDKYLKDGDMSIPLFWVTATISRLVMSKMWLVVYHPHQRRDGGASLPQETKDKLFITSLENIEYSVLLETEARTMKWGWLFRTYVQWHAIAFLLSELCVRTKGEAVERAWRALEATAGRWWFQLGDPSGRKGRTGCLWKPLRKLMAKAKAARDRELALERASLALRASGVPYQEFPHLNNVAGSGMGYDQPSPESLDRMLRPAAAKLGEMPNAQPPSWAGSPALPNSPSASSPSTLVGSNNNSIRNGFSGGQRKDVGIHTANTHQPQAADTFLDTSSYGLDFVIRDVMAEMAFDGTTMYDNVTNETNTNTNNTNNNNAFATNVSSFLHQNQSQPLHPIQTHNPNPFNTNTAAPNLFSPTTDDTGAAADDSPLLLDNGASMDWANWDDLVREFGMDGIQSTSNVAGTGATGTATGALGMGMVNWF